MTAEPTVSSLDPIALRVLSTVLRGQVIAPGDAGYEAARMPWQLHVNQHPAAIVMAADAQDVAAAVRFAGAHDLPVAVQSTGHGAVVPADGGLLINISALRDVTVDAQARTARVGGGVKWGPVLEAAQAVGLAPLLGSTPDVGVAGYSLGGGMGWLAGKHGLAVDSVRAFDIVTPDGVLRHVDQQTDPELFWGVRGGAGNFGVVTSLEIDLYPVTQVYGGNLFFPGSMGREVFRAYRGWVAGLSDGWTTGIVLMNLPPLPFVPEPLRGKTVVCVRGAYVGDMAAGEADLRPMRALGGMIIDAFGPMPFLDVAAISNDPLDPMTTYGRTETLADMSDEAIEAIFQAVGAPPHSPVLAAEVRHVSGAARRAPTRPSAYTQRDADFVLLLLAMAHDPSQDEAVKQYLGRAGELLRPHATGQIYINFLHDTDATGERVRAGFTTEVYARLAALKARVDPANMLRFNRNIPPAGQG